MAKDEKAATEEADIKPADESNKPAQVPPAAREDESIIINDEDEEMPPPKSAQVAKSASKRGPKPKKAAENMPEIMIENSLDASIDMSQTKSQPDENTPSLNESTSERKTRGRPKASEAKPVGSSRPRRGDTSEATEEKKPAAVETTPGQDTTGNETEIPISNINEFD